MKKILLTIILLAILGLGVTLIALPPPKQTLQEDTVWELENSPRILKRRIIVPQGVTLKIKPGVHLQFSRKAGIAVQGRLIAEGTPGNRIHLGGIPFSPFKWGGITFLGTHENNSIAYVNFAENVSRESLMLIRGSTVKMSNLNFINVQRQILEIYDSSVTVLNSTFPPVGEHEVIAGERISPGGQLLIEGNEFHPNTGYKDIIDFSDCARPGPIPVIRNNVFYGGGDDGVDLDRCDAEVFDNIFLNFNRNGHDKYANAVSLGNESQVTISNNLFISNDHGVASQGSSKATILRSTFYKHRIAAITFKEGDHPAGAARVDRCEFRANMATFKHAGEARELEVSHSLLPEANQWPGLGNYGTNFLVKSAETGELLTPAGLPLGARLARDLSARAFQRSP